ncbi:MAG: hypothetical protein J6X55_05110 [Victivallales bacterium]|nr:hypothetical protein [Victivallales bacterium]
MKNRILAMCLCVCAFTSVFAAVDPISSEKLELKAGWNLVTLTRPIVEEHIIKFLGFQPMTLDADKVGYVRCMDKKDIQIGVGYWVFSKKDETIEFTHDQNAKVWDTAGLTEGWNLIGVAKDSKWQKPATVIWQWNNGRFSLVDKDNLKSGKAYFVNYEK